jgi:hypothetical protein
MNSIETLATFFGWCSVINIGFLLALLLRGIVIRKLAVKVFGVTTEEVKAAYMNVFMQYRNATLVLSVTPYIALKIMAW